MVSARRAAVAVLAAAGAVAATVLAPGVGAAACGSSAAPKLELSGPLHLWGPDHNGNWHVVGPGQDSGFDSPLFRPARTPASVVFTGITWDTPTTVPHRFPVSVSTVTH